MSIALTSGCIQHWKYSIGVFFPAEGSLPSKGFSPIRYIIVGPELVFLDLYLGLRQVI